MPISLIRRLYLAAHRTGNGRQCLADLRDHTRRQAGKPADVRARLVDAFGKEPFPFDDVDLEWRPRVQTLRRAFGEPPFPYPGDAVDTARESPEKWMLDIPLFSPDICRYVLPRVLVDLMTVYPGEMRCTDLVVQYLDIDGDHRPENLKDVVPMVEKLIGKGHGANWVQEYKAEADHRREGKLVHFSTFTPAQRDAVLSWLLFARTWPECADVHLNLNSAIEWWQPKAAAE